MQLIAALAATGLGLSAGRAVVRCAAVRSRRVRRWEVESGILGGALWEEGEEEETV